MTPTDELLKEVVGMLREFVEHGHNAEREARARALLAKVDAQSDEEM